MHEQIERSYGGFVYDASVFSTADIERSTFFDYEQYGSIGPSGFEIVDEEIEEPEEPSVELTPEESY